MNNTTLTTTTPAYAALNAAALNDLKEVLRENQRNADGPMPLDSIKAPTGGNTFFTVHGLEGEDAVKEITGIFLTYETPRAYWDTPDPSEGTPPTCHSRDSLVAYNGTICAECPYDEFGSHPKEDSNAKACKQSIEIYMLRPAEVLPIVLKVPASSIRAFREYMGKLTRAGKPLHTVATKVTLVKKESSGGQPYAQFVFNMDRLLSEEETGLLRHYRDEMQSVLAK